MAEKKVKVEQVDPDSTAVPVTNLESQGSIEARLFVLNSEARRMTSRDNVGRVNAEWSEAHRRLNYLLDSWQRAAATGLPVNP